LVSKFTSLVAVDKTVVRSASEKINTQAVAVNPPVGSVMAQFPQTATSATLQFLLGFLLLLTSLFLRWRNA